MDIDESLLRDWEDESMVVNDDDDIAFVSSLQSQYDDKLNFPELDPKTEKFLKSLDEDLDHAFASMLQAELLVDSERKSRTSSKSSKRETTSATSSSKSSEVPLSIVDPQWELIDPHPDIHALFLEFDKRFFYGKLIGVEVKWSPRMTLCAGVCSYEGRGGLCSVRLSVPLLKLRPRRDLVETLLHEMIHAYLFVTHNNRDRDGHGPEFLSHMNRINCETGTKISVYHSFHDEVDVYRQHWWKCDGPCQHRRPFYGFVKRAMNRAPGPRDPWWADHKASCNGTFRKIKEPENYNKKASKRKADAEVDKSQSNIQGFFKKPTPNASSEINLKKPLTKSDKITTISAVSSKESKNAKVISSSSPQKTYVPFQGEGHLLGGSTKKPSLSSLFNSHRAEGSLTEYKKPSSSTGNSCPSPSKFPKIQNAGSSNHSVNGASASNGSKVSGTSKYVQHSIQKFLSPEKGSQASQLKNVGENSLTDNDGDIEILSSTVSCPVCCKAVEMSDINSHLDKCIL